MAEALARVNSTSKSESAAFPLASKHWISASSVEVPERPQGSTLHCVVVDGPTAVACTTPPSAPMQPNWTTYRPVEGRSTVLVPPWEFCERVRLGVAPMPWIRALPKSSSVAGGAGHPPPPVVWPRATLHCSTTGWLTTETSPWTCRRLTVGRRWVHRAAVAGGSVTRSSVSPMGAWREPPRGPAARASGKLRPVARINCVGDQPRVWAKWAIASAVAKRFEPWMRSTVIPRAVMALSTFELTADVPPSRRTRWMFRSRRAWFDVPGNASGWVSRTGSPKSYATGPPARASGKLAPLVTMAVRWPPVVPTGTAGCEVAISAAVAKRSGPPTRSTL